MAPSRPRRPRPPLDDEGLKALALAYVGRFATSRAKLTAYLSRKLRERGWTGEREPDLERIAGRFAELGYVDDAAYALSKSRALAGRGYGKRRLVEKLYAAGIDEEDGEAALEHADREAIAAALRYAERRRIGPFARERASDRKGQEKAVAAMVRAGHSPPLAWAISLLPPGSDIDLSDLAERANVSRA